MYSCATLMTDSGMRVMNVMRVLVLTIFDHLLGYVTLK